MSTENETEINLFVFWPYSNGEFSTFLGGRADRMRDDGSCRVPPYGWVIPVRTVPITSGENILRMIKAEERVARDKIEISKEEAVENIKNILYRSMGKSSRSQAELRQAADACAELQARRRENDALAALCHELGMVNGASVDRLVEAVIRLKNRIRSANETLAEYCSEVDPGRCSLESTIEILIDEVLQPTLKRETLAAACQKAKESFEL